MSQLLNYLKAHREAMTGVLGDLVLLESPSHEREAVNAVADYLARAFGDRGAEVERIPQAAFGDHLRVSWGAGPRQVLLLGHMDTVWPLGEIEERPFHVARDDSTGIIKGTGPGTFDMKGGLVVGLYALAALQDLGLTPTHRLVFLFNSDEECGSPTSRRHIEEEARRSDFVLVLEPSREEALVGADEIGFPLVVRPSYVLGGRAMEIVHNIEDLDNYMTVAIQVSNDSPVLLDRFLNDAIEVDLDAVCDGKDVIIGGIMEHIEEAGVHSGDSSCSLPPFSLPENIIQQLREQATSLALAIGVRGLMNIQFAVKGEDIFLLEVNPRASRTVPFVSKATSRPLAKIGARCMTGISLADQGITGEIIPEYYSVKEAVFPFIKFPGVDPVLGPEMKSTGEVMGVGKTFGEAFDKAQKAAGADIPEYGKAFISVRDIDQPRVVEVARYLAGHGFEILATRGTAKVLEAAGVKVRQVNKVREGRPHIVDMIKNDEIDIVINTTEGKRSLRDSYTIRREALLHKVTNFTTLAAAKAAVEAHRASSEITVYKLQDLHKTLK